MASPPLIYVLNGPNLNLLGLREPEIYGSDTLDEIAGRLEDKAKALGLAIDMRQSNHEGHLIDWLHEAQAAGAKAVLLNAGGYTPHLRGAARCGEGGERACDRGASQQSAGPRELPPPLADRRSGKGNHHRFRSARLRACSGRGRASLTDGGAEQGKLHMAEKTGSEGGMRVDTELVKKLAKMLDENDLSEIEVEDNGRRIVVKRKLGFAPAAAPAPAPPAPAAAPPSPAAAAEQPPESHPGAVKSPMVGTVFLAAEPGSAPFVTPGARVEEGETLVIIEAMKVMNPIAAPRSGIVTQILVQDAQPVEYEQPLAIIE